MARKQPEKTRKADFAFRKENYFILAAGFGIIIIGFLLMMGGKSNDPNVFSDEIFSFRRITMAPLVVLLGFVIELVAIMYKSQPPEEK